MRAEEAWQSVLGEIEVGMGRSSYVTWLKSARLITYEDGQFVIGVANGYAKEWIEQRKLSDIRRMLSERMGRSVDVSLVVMTHNANQPLMDSPRRVEPPAHGAMPAPITRPPEHGDSAASDGLQKRYTFEAFVVGSGNRMAHAAAMAVAEAPAERYNPLFLYGGSGLGKTHLLHAIGNKAKQRGLVCRYVTSETFTNELISAIRSHSQEVFRNRYRYVDMLLMDDVQFIAGKESTQEEFFHTFNALHGANKQIVLTSDRAPKMMVTLEDRLRSRFEWGLMVDIAPPDLETRMAILQHKVAQMGCAIPADVIEFVAKQIQSNVRELEGALTRLLATSEMTGRPITVQFARDTLADLVGRRAHITPSQVIETVARFYNISVADMVSPSRSKELVQPRQIAMYLIRQETDASLPEIGSLLGGRDHTTILHGVERIKDRLETEEQLRRDVMSVREQLYMNVTA
ncbi:MAG: chromosomal replication initiator protein DnaA [Candidatus Roseilinea sp.]|nr:MAG: chromosomal replication initiator protein DnaA [Candidatus Roseilinea sp.]